MKKKGVQWDDKVAENLGERDSDSDSKLIYEDDDRPEPRAQVNFLIHKMKMVIILHLFLYSFYHASRMLNIILNRCLVPMRYIEIHDRHVSLN